MIAKLSFPLSIDWFLDGFWLSMRAPSNLAKFAAESDHSFRGCFGGLRVQKMWNAKEMFEHAQDTRGASASLRAQND